MIRPSQIAALHCPCCDEPLALEGDADPDERVAYGVVGCACYRYPLVDGILLLRQLSHPSNARDPIVAYLDAHDRAGALAAALRLGTPAGSESAPTPLQNFGRALRKVGLERLGARFAPAPAVPPIQAATFVEAVRRVHDRRYADYLSARHANPSFLAALPLLLTFSRLSLPAGPVLDLACGAGHSTFVLALARRGADVVAADFDFTNLYFTRRFHAPEVACLCLDAERPLPFADEALAGVFCLDAFHYVRSKRALVRELHRAVAPTGAWVFAHLHNRDAHNPNPGVPLRPVDYARCFDEARPRLYDERRLVETFSSAGELRLDDAPAPEALASSAALALVGGGAAGLAGHHADLVDVLLDHPRRLRPNPIYKATDLGSSVRLEVCWPSVELRDECEEASRFLPREVIVERRLLRDLQRGHLPEARRAEVAGLLRDYAFVATPERYGSLW